ncbi:NADHX epimerase / NADHX dehydratase [Rhodococcus sp. B7740]|uniref:bifunctional ADP-dependent NAD(P)H-hydrate dehydratase/NAD(P)H-hydrate epimerase n=1 Tax=Rhodococcus sp. B7740 TaxID=1564114 RepID=UPI0005D9C82B|nr:bifunctional ADP-dependent NAD(P)H-hydrate dehydratase/NAD(P)H-hydrate epimerase [Rhodococcus sp. B7740]AJW39882.1 NADHX epimerase / NADHX dehydratase [Rhodococcus sp. B7740]
MRGYYTPEQIRNAEAPLLDSLPNGVLMRRAAYGLAAVVAGELTVRTGGVVGRRVTILVGTGDNGGDGLWAGAFLRRRGVSVSALLLDPTRVHPEGLAALRSAGGRVVSRCGPADLVVDAIVGISGKGPLRPDAAAVVEQITAPIVAVDVPSGVDAETGAAPGPAVTADVTVTFGARKPVHALAVPRCGRIELVDIGLELPAPAMTSFEPVDVGRIWPIPTATDDKYSQGVVGVLAGSDTFPGAALLCVGAAVAATSGMVRYVGSAGAEVVSHYPEVVSAPNLDAAGKVQAWVVGPGFGTHEESAEIVRRVLDTDLPVVVDADALTVLARNERWVAGRAAPTLLTPHAGEFARLTGSDPAPDRVGSVRDLAARWGVTVLLKGRATIVADADGTTFVSDAGGSAASTAGSGDVLSGILGALLASGMAPSTAAACGAKVHALAAARAAHGSDGEFAAPISASPLCESIRDAIRTVRSLTM